MAGSTSIQCLIEYEYIYNISREYGRFNKQNRWMIAFSAIIISIISYSMILSCFAEFNRREQTTKFRESLSSDISNTPHHTSTKISNNKKKCWIVQFDMCMDIYTHLYVVKNDLCTQRCCMKINFVHLCTFISILCYIYRKTTMNSRLSSIRA